MPNAFITYVPLLIIALIAVFMFWSIRGKEIPDRAVGIAAPIVGVIFLILLSHSPFGLAFGALLIGIGGFAWYRYLRGRPAEDGKPDSTA